MMAGESVSLQIRVRGARERLVEGARGISHPPVPVTYIVFPDECTVRTVDLVQ